MILTVLEALVALALLPHASTPGRQAPPAPPAPRPMITVHLQSGRVFSGDVDFQTDEHEFVLRTNRSGGCFVRPILWDRVVGAEIAGEVISGAQLQHVVAEIRRGHPKPPAERVRLTVDFPAMRPSQGR